MGRCLGGSRNRNQGIVEAMSALRAEQREGIPWTPDDGRLLDPEERYRIVADHSLDWDFWVGADGRYEYVSPSCEEICGYPPEEFLADPHFMECLLHPEDLSAWLTHWGEIKTGGVLPARAPHLHPPIELRIVHPDGEVRWIEHQCRPVYDREGRYRGRRGVNRHISARKRAEAHASSLSRMYATLSETNQEILRAQSAPQALEGVIQAVVMVGRFRACAITVRDPCTGNTELVTQLGLRSIDALSIPWVALESGVPLIRSYEAERVMRAATPEESVPALPSAAPSTRSKVAFAHCPLRSKGELIGVLSVGAHDPTAYSPEILDLLCQLAADLSFALFFFAQQDRRRAAERALQESESRYRRIFDTTLEGVWSLDPDLRLTHVNESLARMLGYAAHEMTGRSLLEFMFPEDCEDQMRLMARRSAGHSDVYDRRMRGRDGQEVLFRVAATPLLDARGQFEGAFAVLSNISLRRQAEQALQHNLLLRGLFDCSPVAMVLLEGAEQRVKMVNREFLRTIGYGTEEVPDLGALWTRLYPQTGRREQAKKEWSELFRDTGGEPGHRRSLETQALCRGGAARVFQVQSSTIGEDRLVVLVDITEQRESERRLSETAGKLRQTSRAFENAIRFLDHHDRLTRLPNWVALMNRLRTALDLARGDARVAVLFVDLDRFKQVNDSLGHAVGDGLLRSVAQRLIARIRADETLARIAGDQFVILLGDGPKLERTQEIACRIRELFQRPLFVRGHELFVTASIGISVYPTDGEDAETLLKFADLATHQAKALGRNSLQFYQAEMAASADSRLKIESALRGALNRGEFTVQYQPQVDLETGELVGVEALLRWKHPDLGQVSPSQFIPIAEDMGVIGELGAWVLEESCRQLLSWDRQGRCVPRVAVNLSVQQLQSDSLVGQIERLIVEGGLDATRLEVEITESMIMRQAEQAIEVLSRIRTLGVQVAVDDFGTGYSSLGYIQRLPLDRLKVDASFVRDIGRSADGENIVRAIVGLGTSIGMTVVAEGIEREEQAEFLVQAGCDVGQGYLFGAPCDPAEIAAWIRR